MIALNRVVVTGMGAITPLGKAIRESIVPPTINTNNPESGYAGKFNLTLGQSQSREIRYAMNNTFGFGGHIASTIFKKYETVI